MSKGRSYHLAPVKRLHHLKFSCCGWTDRQLLEVIAGEVKPATATGAGSAGVAEQPNQQLSSVSTVAIQSAVYCKVSSVCSCKSLASSPGVERFK